MLREYRAGTCNSTRGKRTEFLKELLSEMRQELAILFFLDGKAKEVF